MFLRPAPHASLWLQGGGRRPVGLRAATLKDWLCVADSGRGRRHGGFDPPVSSADSPLFPKGAIRPHGWCSTYPALSCSPRCRRDTVLRRAEAGHLPPSNTAGRSERSDRRERPFEGTRGDHHPAYDLQPDSAAPDCGGGRGRASAPRAATHLPPAPGPRGGAAAATFSCPRWTCTLGRLSASQGPTLRGTCPPGIPQCAVPCPPC